MVYSFYDILWLFLFYALLGWCCEVIYAALNSGTFVNRGFLSGPVCPIYGVGMVLVLLSLTPLSHHYLLLFLGAAAVTSLLEYITGFVLEKIFHDKWWDYSDEHFNLHGYICLKFSILWGLACVLVVKVVAPSIDALYRLIPRVPGMIILCICYTALAVDLIVTVIGISRLPGKLKKLEVVEEKLHTISDTIGKGLSDKTLEAKEKNEDVKAAWDTKKQELDALLDHRRHLRDSLGEGFIERRIGRAFPRLTRQREKDRKFWKQWKR